MNIYYVYAYLRTDGTPYYIGKGKGRRAYLDHRHCPVPKDKSRIVFLAENLTEKTSLDLEVELIRSYGRKDLGTGILINLTDGGEGSSGVIVSEETRRKMSEAKKGIVPSDEARHKMSQSHKGIVFSDKHRRKLSESGKGRVVSDETRHKLSKAGKSRTHSDETRRKISEARKRTIALQQNQSSLDRGVTARTVEG